MQQQALAEFIRCGELEKYLRKMRRVYTKRYHHLFNACAALSGDLVRPIPINTGVHMSAYLTERVNASELRMRLLEHDVAISCWQDFSEDHHAPNGLIFGFGRIASEDIAKGMEIVAEQIRQMAD